MHRSITIRALFFALLASALPAGLSAAPIIIGLPVSKSAYVTASANVTLDVAAVTTNGTLTYQWGTVVSSVFTPVSNSTTYSGVTSANLTINNTDTSLNGTKYKCIITDSADLATITTGGVTLNVFGPPANTASILLSTGTIASNSTANLTLTVSGLVAGHTIKVQHYLDSANTGLQNVIDPLLESFVITENHTASFGGVTDPLLPGDDLVHTPNGTITTHLNLSTSSELSRIAGTHILKIASPTGDFLPITTTFTVTKPAYSQSVSGQVLINNVPLAHARVGMLQQTGGGNSEFVAGTFADSNGDFTLNAPAGNGYTLLVFTPGYVSNFATAPQFNLATNDALTNRNPVAVPATCMIVGKTQDPNLTPVPGMQLFASDDNNDVTIATSNNDGAFVVPALVGNWSMDVSDNSVNQVGYLRPTNKPTITTTTGTDNSSLITNPLIFAPVNALIYGTMKNGSTGLANVEMDGNDINNTSVKSNTDATGTYYLGVNAPTNTNNAVADDWNVSANSSSAALSGLIAPNSQDAQLFSGQSQELDFVAAAATAFLNGTVKFAANGSVASNVIMDATLQVSGNSPGTTVQSTTDSNGNFSLGVYAGNWSVQLNSQDSNQNQVNIVGPQINETVADGNHLNVVYNGTIQYFPIITGAYNITGNVLDINNQPVSFNGISATANINVGGIGVVDYNSNAQTDQNGVYTLPVINGTWTVSPSQNGYTSQNATINGSGQVVNFSPGFAITQQPNNQDVPTGQPATFSIQTNAASNVTFQWQDSTDGNTWNNITNNTNYSGNNTANLTVSNTTSALSGLSYRCVATYTTTSTTLDSNSAYLVVSTAALIGTVTENSVPVANVSIQAVLQNNGQGNTVFVQGTTDSNGNFSLGVYAGNWTIQLTSFGFNGQPVNLIGPNLNETVTNGNNISGINYPVLADTATISGRVIDINGNPVQNNFVSGTANISNVNYQSNANTDSNGNYTMSVVNGVWSVTPNFNGIVNSFVTQNVTVNNNSPTGINFAQSLITQQPVNQSISTGSSAQFSVQTSTSNNVTYQWQTSTNGGSSWSNLTNDSTYSNVANSILFLNNTPGNLSGQLYRCVVTYTNTSNVTASTNSASASLTVSTPPGISSQPSGTSVFAGANAFFSLTANGTPAPTYQWQLSTNNGGNWSNLTENSTYNGTTTSSLTVNSTTLAMNNNQFRCVVSNVANSITSNGVLLTVNASFTSWQDSNFNQNQLNDPTISGPTATPGLDGIPNLVKYAFNLPIFSNQQPSLPHPTLTAGKLTLVFTKLVNDVTYTVQSSTDAITWVTNDPNLSLQVNGSTVTASYTLSGHAPAFLRILITKP